VFVYLQEGETTVTRQQKQISHAEFFKKLAQGITASLNTVTAEGFVFRVDTRLRPYGEEGPLVVSADFLAQYFEREARLWERFAWFKARALTGSAAEQATIQSIVQPFVLRRYFDYTAYEGLRDLHQKIRAEGHRTGGDNNIKLGRGGIRECEFFIQLQQIVHAGRNSHLRQQDSLGALAALAQAHHISPTSCEQLSQAYRFLRLTEHALQYENDEQTQSLPFDSTGQAALARVLQFTDWTALLATLNQHRDCIANHFESLLKSEQLPNTSTAPFDADLLQRLGYSEAVETHRYCDALLTSPALTRLTEARRRITQLLPLVAQSATAFEQADNTLKRWCDLLETIAGRTAYLALLSEYPKILQPISRLLARSAWGARYLRQHPILLDDLIDRRPQPLDASTWLAELQQALQTAPDTEAALACLRQHQQAHTFQILIADCAGLLSIEQVSDYLSYLADCVVLSALVCIWQGLSKSSSAIPLSVVAYGRWGGKELGYGSDLDLVFIVADHLIDTPQMALASRAAQRLITWLSTATEAGVCYDIDTRLRPDGGAGVLVTTLNAYANYQREHAWTWERQALTRARYAVGDKTTGLAFERLRKQLLQLPPKLNLQADIVAMRHRMSAQKASKSSGFHVKNDSGGMVDIEFIMQALILQHGQHTPTLLDNLGNIALLERAAQAKLLSQTTAQQLANAYRDYRAFQHARRLNEDSEARCHDNRFDTQREQVKNAWAKILS
jgi:[glutamine synthetase] adenylyltransferase / [glutamine synthetase]-adenylyl-L-tyrosine phosphorylase